VLRTGFDTTQGSLMRTILFSTERVTVNNWEALAFIGILLIFAVAASAYVLIKGLEDESRSRYKLLLHCVMIITSVVPPELPMELSLAVNNSLIALQKLGIFCTEPFRIPVAGAVDVCCFDKTGTLTSDDFHVRGIAGLGGCSDPLLPSSGSSTEAAEALTPAASAWESTKWVLAACNALVHVDSQMIGDPVEKSALSAVNFSMSKGDVATSKASNLRLRIVNRFPFASELKRMSTLVAVESDTPTATSTVTSRHVALCKGAPEEIGSRLKEVPEHYQRCYQYFSLRGFRVLALAVKEFRVMQPAELRTITRADCEVIIFV
jgi:cation-transporting ATPase 13A1